LATEIQSHKPANPAKNRRIRKAANSDIDAIMAHGTHVMWSYKLVEVSHAHLNYDEVHSSYIDAYSFGRRLNPLNGLKS
jgi:hypothetical protein